MAIHVLVRGYRDKQKYGKIILHFERGRLALATEEVTHKIPSGGEAPKGA